MLVSVKDTSWEPSGYSKRSESGPPGDFKQLHAIETVQRSLSIDRLRPQPFTCCQQASLHQGPELELPRAGIERVNSFLTPLTPESFFPTGQGATYNLQCVTFRVLELRRICASLVYDP